MIFNSKSMNIKIIFTYIFLFLIVISCKKDAGSISLHENYFPLENGRFVEYDVTSITHNVAAGIPETTNYVLKTVVGDTIIDNSGRIARKFSRWIFNVNENKFIIKDLWTAIIDQNRAELVEENERIIKLVFSPSLKKVWDMNAFNSRTSVESKYENIHNSASIGSFTFDSTVTVVEEKFENLIEFRKKYEIYAKKVGLIYKCFKVFEISSGDTLNPLVGTEIYYKIRNYGIE